MEEPYPAYTRSPDPGDKESATKKLRRLRILLILWLVCFVMVVLWFTFSPDL